MYIYVEVSALLPGGHCFWIDMSYCAVTVVSNSCIVHKKFVGLIPLMAKELAEGCRIMCIFPFLAYVPFAVVKDYFGMGSDFHLC